MTTEKSLHEKTLMEAIDNVEKITMPYGMTVIPYYDTLSIIRQWAAAKMRKCENFVNSENSGWDGLPTSYKCKDAPMGKKCLYCRGLIKDIPLTDADLKSESVPNRTEKEGNP